MKRLQHLLYTIPIAGAFIYYNDLRRQDDLIEEKLASNPQLSKEETDILKGDIARSQFPTYIGNKLEKTKLPREIIGPLLVSLASELVVDVSYVAPSSMAYFLHQLDTPMIMLLGVCDAVTYLARYAMTNGTTQILRGYEQTGKIMITLPTNLPTHRTIEI